MQVRAQRVLARQVRVLARERRVWERLLLVQGLREWL